MSTQMVIIAKAQINVGLHMKTIKGDVSFLNLMESLSTSLSLAVATPLFQLLA